MILERVRNSEFEKIYCKFRKPKNCSVKKWCEFTHQFLLSPSKLEITVGLILEIEFSPQISFFKSHPLSPQKLVSKFSGFSFLLLFQKGKVL